MDALPLNKRNQSHWIHKSEGNHFGSRLLIPLDTVVVGVAGVVVKSPVPPPLLSQFFPKNGGTHLHVYVLGPVLVQVAPF